MTTLGEIIEDGLGMGGIRGGAVSCWLPRLTPVRASASRKMASA